MSQILHSTISIISNRESSSKILKLKREKIVSVKNQLARRTLPLEKTKLSSSLSLLLRNLVFYLEPNIGFLLNSFSDSDLFESTTLISGSVGASNKPENRTGSPSKRYCFSKLIGFIL